MAKYTEKKDDTRKTENVSPSDQVLRCGIIMPIADIEGYPVGHWRNVQEIIREASESAGFKAELVSSDDDVAVIQKRIVQNLYDNPIVVCDISARNANVMFELGMRLAFDKPTVIIKDERTPYSFDISSIEHLDYPSDLRYQSINLFKERLAGKIKETYQKSINDPNYTTFLKHFGTFKVAQLEQKEVSESEFLASEIKDIKSLIISLRTNISSHSTSQSSIITYPKSSRSIRDVDASLNIKKNGVASYIIEPEGFRLDAGANYQISELLERAAFEPEQVINKGKSLVIHFKSPMTLEEEQEFKNVVVSNLL